MRYDVTLFNGTVITKEANSGNEAMNMVMREDSIDYEDLEAVTPSDSN